MNRVRNWMYRNARPIDLARYRYHFEGGDANDVLLALQAYQNADGGFGHALEADLWSPHSTPIQTWCATQILMEIGETSADTPVVANILKYLRSGAHFKGGRWSATTPENALYPHAPWWTHNDNEREQWGDNPTAALAAFMMKVDPADDFARDIARAAADRYINSDKVSGGDLLNCMYRLTQAFPEDRALKERYVADALKSVNPNEAEWGGYACRPSSILLSAENPAAEALKGVIAREIAYLRRARNEHGVWNITWRWQGYDSEFAISANWWMGDIAVKMLLFLRAFGETL